METHRPTCVPASGRGLTPAATGNDIGEACRHCAQIGPTCCQHHDIFVTGGDCRRIYTHTGRIDFWEFRTDVDERYGDQRDDPVWAKHVFRTDGSRRVVKQTDQGDCLFLGCQGCTLPLTVRPLVCRLYPLCYTAGGILGGWDTECRQCLMPPQFPNTDIGIAGVAPDLALQWHALLYRELPGEGINDGHWIDL